MGFLDFIRDLSPDAKREMAQFAGRVISTAAHPCDAPGCTGKSVPGMQCACGKRMCADDALFTALPSPHAICAVCAHAIWNRNVKSNPKPRRKRVARGR